MRRQRQGAGPVARRCGGKIRAWTATDTPSRRVAGDRLTARSCTCASRSSRVEAPRSGTATGTVGRTPPPPRQKGHTASCVWRGPAAARGFISPVPRSDDLAQPCAPGDGRQQKPLRSTQDIAVVESDAEEPTERVCRVACCRHMDD
jgi:hypothetical protein